MQCQWFFIARSPGLEPTFDSKKEASIMQFGCELFRLRQIAGLQQSAVARKSGVSRGYYGQLENSRKPPPPNHTIGRIADALELTRAQRCHLVCLAMIERESCLSLLSSEGLKAILKELAFKADVLSTHQIRRIAEILEEIPSV
jgi:transcriptional regulator with XRE-family HTH domain